MKERKTNKNNFRFAAALAALTFGFLFLPGATVRASLIGDLQKGFLGNSFSFEKIKIPEEIVRLPKTENKTAKPAANKVSLPKISFPADKISSLGNSLSSVSVSFLGQVSSGILDGGKNYIDSLFDRFRTSEEAPKIDPQAIRRKNTNTAPAQTRGELNVNAASQFRSGFTSAQDATFNQNIVVQGTLNTNALNLGGNVLTAANLLLGVLPGEGITISGTQQQPIISSTLWRQSGSSILPGSARSLYINELSLTDETAATTSVARLSVRNASSSEVGILVEGASGQSANLLSLRNSDSRELFAVDSGGKVFVGTSSQTTDNALTVSGSANITGTTTAKNLFSSSDAYLATTGGRVGVGTQNPTDTLTIQGSFGLSGALRLPLLGCSGDLETDSSGNVTCGTDERGSSSSGSNNGTVQSGNANRLAYYPSDGRTLEEAANLYYNGGLGVGISTSTVGVIQTTGVINVGGAGTSTFANGLNLTTGCLAINGTCLSSGGSAGGSTGQIQFNSANTFGGASNFFYDSASQSVGIGTSTPGKLFSVSGDLYFNSATTTYASSSASVLSFKYEASATSTILSDTFNAWTIATTTNSKTGVPPLFSVGSSGGLPRIGVGTSTPYATFSVESMPGTVKLAVGSNTKTNFLIDADGDLVIDSSQVIEHLGGSWTNTLDMYDGGGSVRITPGNASGGFAIVNGGGAIMLSVSQGNYSFFQSPTDNSSAFQVRNSSSQAILNVDTSNFRFGVGTSTPGALFSLSAVNGAVSNSNFLLSGINTIYASSSTSTIGSDTYNAFSIATSTAGVPPLFSVGSTGGWPRVGIATGTPSAMLAIDAPRGIPLLAIGSSTDTILSINSLGFVGIGIATSTDYFHVAPPKISGSANGGSGHAIKLYAGSGRDGTTIGSTGGTFAIASGEGGSGSSIGGSGGEISITGGKGSVATGVGGVAGIGGTITITAGAGGIPTGASATGGNGGGLTLSAGSGSTGTGSGGGGGSVTISAGAGGSGSTNGSGGSITLKTGAGSTLSNRLLITNEGLFGIGTSTPGALFSLAATTTSSVYSNFLLSGINTIYASSSTSTIASSVNGFNFVTASGNSLLSFDGSNNRIGIATSTPAAAFSIGAGNSYLNSNLITLASSSASTLTISYEAAATSTIPTSKVYAWSIATSTTAQPLFTINTNDTFATSSFRGGFTVADTAIEYDYSSGVTSVDNLQIGSQFFEADAGIVNWVDMPISSSASANTIESFTAALDGNPLLTLYSRADGSGGIGTTSIAIGTSTGAYLLHIASTSPTFAITDTDAALNEKNWLFTNVNGNLMVGTSSDVYASSSLPHLTFLSGRTSIGIGSTTPTATTSLSLAAGLRLQLLKTNVTQAVCFDAPDDGGNGALLVDCGGGTPADYAEFYPTENGLETGDLVMPSSIVVTTVGGRVAKLTKTQDAYEQNILGVVSDPEHVTDFNTVGVNDVSPADNPLPIALNGRVPVKVSTENGPVKIGDRITSSSLAGVGMKAGNSGMVVGFALEEFDPAVNSGQASTTAMVNGQPVQVGKVMVFISLGYAKLDDDLSSLASGETNAWSVDQQSGKVNVGFFGDINMNGNDIIEVGKILSQHGKWRIDSDGILTAEKIIAKDLEVKNGILLYDEDTGDPYCVRIRNGALVSAAGACGSNQPAGESVPQQSSDEQPADSQTGGSESPAVEQSGGESTAAEPVEAQTAITESGVEPETTIQESGDSESVSQPAVESASAQNLEPQISSDGGVTNPE